MDFKKHLVTAWELTLKFIVPLILMTLVMTVVSCVTLGILAPVLAAGYMQSILLMVRNGREPDIKDLFSEMSLFLPLLVFGIVAFIAIGLGLVLLVLPGLVIALGLAYVCLYMLPLMTDKKLALIDAIKESFAMAKGDPGEHFVVAIVFVFISAIGGSVVLGTLFTQPLATIFLISVYNEKVAESELVSQRTPGGTPESVSLEK
jgi:hypothetical protein